ALPYFARKVPIPYLCVDFLHDGRQFWLSEIEPDGVISTPDRSSDEANKITRMLMQARFTAYRRSHLAWLAADRPFVHPEPQLLGSRP
ncbi:MAG: hypothetical protein ACM30G_17375, partial [Micromonosporaceae bacterium]